MFTLLLLQAVYEKGVEGEPYMRKPTKTTDHRRRQRNAVDGVSF